MGLSSGTGVLTNNAGSLKEAPIPPKMGRIVPVPQSDLSPSGPRTWHFISARPSSDLEDRRNRSVVRAHASRSRRRHPKTANDSRNPESGKVTLELNESKQVDHIDPAGTAAHHARQFRIASPTYSTRSNASFDPFETYPSNLPRKLIDKLMPSILNQTTRLLPPLHPRDENERWGIYTVTWLRSAIYDRALFHTALFASLFNSRNTLNTDSARTREELLCYQIVLQEVARKLSDSKLAISDEAIQTVCCMAIHGEGVVERVHKSPRQGPFRSLQMLDLYGGGVSSSGSHTRALFIMLHARGGIEKLNFEGMSQLACYIDILCANREMRRPVFRFISRVHDPEDELRRIAATNVSLPALGTGFSQLDDMLDLDQVASLRTVLGWMRNYTLILDSCASKSSTQISMGLLADMRNFVQHGLLSLSARGNLKMNAMTPLFEMCYTAALIYSWIVTFPAPLHAVPVHEAAMRIRQLLDKEEVDKYWIQTPYLMIWIVFMGALASFGSTEEQGYVCFLSRALPRLEIHSWEGLKGHLETFLWYPSASDLDGVDLYQEILQCEF